MCDFVLDAAYPFKNGRAKVIYKGKNYDIDKLGNGLPMEVDRDTRILSRKYQAQTVNQLYKENQHEKAMQKGDALYKEIIEGNNSCLCDITADELLYAVQAEYAAIGSQNSLMAMLLQSPDLFDYYQSKNLNRRFSAESGLYELNEFNSTHYLQLFKSKYPSDDIVSQILNYADDSDYKSAILEFEKWIEEKNIKIGVSAIELMVYYYLAELSDDFETANRVLISIAKLYEDGGFEGIKDTYYIGSLLLDIRKCQSARTKLEQATQDAKSKNDAIKEIVCYYNLAILYETANDDKQCQSYYRQALKTLQKCKANNLPVNLKNGILSNYINYLLSHGLWSNNYCDLFNDYIRSEIDFNINVFLSNDVLHVNKIWGRSMTRIKNILQHLDSCNNDSFIKGAMTLAVFQQSIVADTEKSFLTGMRDTKNEEITLLISEYLRLKRDYKGFDLFDVGESNLSNKGTAMKISRIEKQIKTMLSKEGIMRLDVDYMAPLRSLKEHDVAIDVVEYTVNSTIKKYGAFIIKGHQLVKFVSLGKEDRFSSEDFWPTIARCYNFNVNDNYYLFAGKLDQKGLEYEDIEKGDCVYFRYNLHRVHSLANMNPLYITASLKSISLFGGMDYGEELIAKSRGAIENGYLEYSKKEIDAVSETLKYKMSISSFSGKEGTTERFLKDIMSTPNIIHLATHGYQKDLNTLQWTSIEGFLNQDRFNYYRQNTDVESMEWLMNNTGLFFSISDKDTVNVLYSREVASCDLSKASLVVLSACSTLSGKISDNYSSSISLTTAFAIAQAQNVITSLQDVDDEKTYEFMILFYSYLKETDDIYSSFKSAVKTMKAKYPNNKDVWGTFILLENH